MHMTRQRVFSRRAAVVALATLLSMLMLVSGSIPEAAKATGSPQDGTVDRQVEELLQANPGSRRLDATSVQLESGIVMTVLVDPPVTHNTGAGTSPDRAGAAYAISASCWIYSLSCQTGTVSAPHTNRMILQAKWRGTTCWMSDADNGITVGKVTVPRGSWWRAITISGLYNRYFAVGINSSGGGECWISQDID